MSSGSSSGRLAGHMRRAEQEFRRDERHRAVMGEEAKRVASDVAKTARLRELRLAKEAADRATERRRKGACR